MEGKINDISPKKSSSKRSSNIFDLSTTEFNIGSSTLNNSNGGNAGSFNLETSTSNGNTRSNYHEFTIIPSTLNNNNVQSNVVDSNKNNDPEIIYKDNKIKKRGLSESNSTALNDANASINGSSIDIRSFNKRRIEDSFKKDSSLKSDIIKGEEKEFTKTSHVSIKSENDYLGFRNNILNPYGNAKSKFNTDSNESNGDKTYFIETKEDGNVADYFKDFSNINNQSTSFQKEILVKEEQESKSISGGIYKNVAQKYFGSQLNSQGSIKAESDLQSLNSLESAGKNDVDLNKRADFDANKPLKGLDQIIRNYSGDIFDQSKFEGIKNSIEKDCSSVEIHGAQFLNKEELGLRAPSGFGEIKTLKIYKDEVKGDNRTNFNDITNVIINNDNQPMAQSFDFLKELTKNGSFEDQLAGLIRVPKEHRYESLKINQDKKGAVNNLFNKDTEFEENKKSNLFDLDPLRLAKDPFTVHTIRAFLNSNNKNFEDPNSIFSFKNDSNLNERSRNAKDDEKYTKYDLIKDMRNESYSKYYPVIKEFIHKISKYESFNPVIEFEKAFKSINLKSDKHIGETWKILSYLTTERYDSSDSSKIKQVSKLKFSREYQAATVEDHQSLMSIQSRMNLNQASLAYLHSDFIELIKEFVNQKIIYCELGGNPTINDFIKAFIKLKFRTLKMRSGGYEVYESPKTYFWTHLYYLFRCGLYKDCSDYCYMSASLNFNESEKYILECFITFLNRDDKFLPNSFRIKLQDIYNTVEKVSDPYKYTICKIIGRFDIRDVYVPEVTETFYDFLWAKFNIFQEDLKLTPLKENQHMLSDIQNEIHNEGAENIISGRCSPIEYVNILLLTHQFEAAIAYLLTDSQFHSEALHIFTSLCYYGLIRVSDLTDPVGWEYVTLNSTVSDQPVYPKLNAGLVYSRTLPWFTNYRVEEIFDYLFLYTLIPSKEYKDCLLNRVVNVCIATDGFYDVFGRPAEAENPYKFKQGVIEKYSNVFENEKEYKSFRQNALRQMLNYFINENDLEKAFYCTCMVEGFEYYVTYLNSSICRALEGYFQIDFNPKNPNSYSKIDEVKAYYQALKKIHELGVGGHSRISERTSMYSLQLSKIADFAIATDLGDTELIRDTIVTLPFMPYSLSNLDQIVSYVNLVEILPDHLVNLFHITLFCIPIALVKFKLIPLKPQDGRELTIHENILLWVNLINEKYLKDTKYRYNDFGLPDISDLTFTSFL